MLRGIVAVATVLVLGACGGGGAAGGDTAGGATEEPGAGRGTLTMVDNAFEPADATFGAGAEVQLVNDGEALHNLTVEGTAIDEDVESGQSTTVTLDLDPGEYSIVCEYHEAAGMTGTVTIE